MRLKKIQVSGSVIRPKAMEWSPVAGGARTNAPIRIKEDATSITREGASSGLIRDNIWFYLKAALTSGLIRTTSDQMPIGKPMMQQGLIQGIIARTEATTAKFHC